jgi:hypothetical protein
MWVRRTTAFGVAKAALGANGDFFTYLRNHGFSRGF